MGPFTSSITALDDTKLVTPLQNDISSLKKNVYHFVHIFLPEVADLLSTDDSVSASPVPWVRKKDRDEIEVGDARASRRAGDSGG